jgi:hypothetical protein
MRTDYDSGSHRHISERGDIHGRQGTGQQGRREEAEDIDQEEGRRDQVVAASSAQEEEQWPSSFLYAMR